MNKQLANHDGIAEAWLDIDTYGLPSIADQTRALSSATQADVQRAATRLFYNTPTASVVIGNSDLVKSQLERYGKVELMGEIKPMPEKPSDKNSTKPQNKSLKPE
jgi:hypothetical protein